MLSFNNIQDLIAGTFLDGNLELAGIVMYLAAVVLIFGLTRGNTFMALVVGMGATLFFTILGILSAEITVLLIIVSALGLAYASRNVWRD